MPIIKYIAVHASPIKLFRYMTKESKTEKTLVTSLNCSEEIAKAYNDFKFQFECFSNERFYKKSLDGKAVDSGKHTVRVHHYIQSFKPGEITAAEAHQIGLEWARAVFGNNHSVMLATHIDRGHIHNHFAVSVYDQSGKRWLGNKKTLTRCRSISDRIAKNHGLSVIEKPKYKANHKYGEHKARKGGYSWKQNLCDQLDEIILKPTVKSVDDLVKELLSKGYEVHRGKYLAVKVKPNRKAIRTYRLGDGYSLEHLEYRIQHKNMEMPLSEVFKYEGIQRDYAMCIRQIQIEIYRKPENDRLHLATYREVEKSLKILRYICDNNVKSDEDFKRKVDVFDEKASALLEEKEKILNGIAEQEKNIMDAQKYLELKSKKVLLSKDIEEIKKYRHIKQAGIEKNEDIEIFREQIQTLKEQAAALDTQIEKIKSEQKSVSDIYNAFTESLKSDYEILLERAKAEIENIRLEEQRRKEENAEKSSEQEYPYDENAYRR